MTSIMINTVDDKIRYVLHRGVEEPLASHPEYIVVQRENILWMWWQTTDGGVSLHMPWVVVGESMIVTGPR